MSDTVLQSQLIDKSSSKILIGNRIPKEYFVTSGCGESDVTVHAGSYDEALKEAGICNYNIIAYSSIMPRNAVRVDKPSNYVHGSVAEVIMATKSGHYGERLTAGIVVGWIKDKRAGEMLGGLVAEYNGYEDEEDATAELTDSIEGMFRSRYGPEDNMELANVEVYVRSFIPRKKFGTVMVDIVFTSYEYPVLQPIVQELPQQNP